MDSLPGRCQPVSADEKYEYVCGQTVLCSDVSALTVTSDPIMICFSERGLNEDPPSKLTGYLKESLEAGVGATVVMAEDRNKIAPY